jgi:hypothetical protein
VDVLDHREREATRRLGVKFREVEREQNKQRETLDGVQKFLVDNFVTRDELVHLEKLEKVTPFPFHRLAPFREELKRLISLGLIMPKPGHSLDTLFRAHDDVQKHLEITPQGSKYLEYRSEPESREG